VENLGETRASITSSVTLRKVTEDVKHENTCQILKYDKPCGQEMSFIKSSGICLKRRKHHNSTNNKLGKKNKLSLILFLILLFHFQKKKKITIS
jgi:hypothetical protein